MFRDDNWEEGVLFLSLADIGRVPKTWVGPAPTAEDDIIKAAVAALAEEAGIRASWARVGVLAPTAAEVQADPERWDVLFRAAVYHLYHEPTGWRAWRALANTLPKDSGEQRMASMLANEAVVAELLDGDIEAAVAQDYDIEYEG